MAALVELAETLQAPVVDQGGRMNFPSRHPLNQTRARGSSIADADVDPRPRADRLLGHGRTRRATRSCARRGRSSKPGTKLISITARRSRDEGQLSGLPALPGSGPRDGGRRRSDAAGADRGVQAAHHRRSPRRVRGARRHGSPRRTPAALRARARRRRLRVGRQPDQHGAPVGGAVGADQERGLGAGRRERHHERLDRRGSGPSTSTISRSADRAARASATARRRRSARRWPTGSTDGCRSRIQGDGDFLVRARRVVDGGASPHSAARASCTTTARTTRR